MKLILASNNKDKLREIREILSGTGIEIVSQREAGCDFEADENGTTFSENARIKALAAVRATGLPAASDDSGLVIAALGGRPGVYSARYGGECGYDKKCAMILSELEGKSDRSAAFVSAVVCIFPNGDEITAEGIMRGSIAYTPAGDGGFGYDPIFLPDGCDKTAAELTDDEKNAISHRGQAFREFAEKLKVYIDDKRTEYDKQ